MSFTVRVVKHWNRLPRGGRCPSPGDSQGHTGPGSEQPDLDEDVPFNYWGVGLDDI